MFIPPLVIISLFSYFSIFLVAVGLFFSYIKGIDPTNIQLLCDPYDTTVPLSSIKLEYSGGQFDNPLILNEAGSIDDVVDCVFGSSKRGIFFDDSRFVV